MGMAASQARFLGLTARKTNTEFEGQQINQQRTTLSNQSANYYNQLLGMTVPVPPSVDDYTKTVYSFTDGALTNTLTSMVANVDGKYKVSYLSTYTNDFAVVSATPAIYTKTDNGYRVGAVSLRELCNAPAPGQNDPYYESLNAAERTKLMEEERSYLDQLNLKFTTNDGDWLVRYVQNTSDGTWKPLFTRKADLDDTKPNSSVVYDQNGNSLTSIKTYTIGSAQESREIKGVDARMEKDASGRIINITLYADTDQAVTYAVSTSTVTDQDKYTDAMNQYEYDKNQYQQTIQEINAKIEVVQAEDRNLELRLKQLDTEQSAIQTEMEAVSKIIEKNTESTFKTFG